MDSVKKDKRLNYGKYGLIFIAPFFIMFLIFQLYPIMYSIILSFTDYEGYMEVTRNSRLHNIKN